MLSQLATALGNNSGAVLAVLITVIGASAVTVISSVCVLSAMWRSVRVREEENDLKREMLARGMSVDEIVRVMGASADPDTIREQRRTIRRGGREFALSLGIPISHN